MKKEKEEHKRESGRTTNDCSIRGRREGKMELDSHAEMAVPVAPELQLMVQLQFHRVHWFVTTFTQTWATTFFIYKNLSLTI